MNLKKDAIYNTAGNFIYLGSMWLITVLAVRLADFESAGLLAIAMSTANIFISIASYSMRFYYASDIEGKYSDVQYILSRIITIVLSVLVCIIASVAIQYNIRELLAIFLFYMYKCAEMASDILYGTLQRHGCLYYCGYSLIIKSVLSLSGFSISLYITKNLNISLLVITLIAGLILFFFDCPLVLKKARLLFRPNKQDLLKSFQLLKLCFPLFIIGLCYNMIPSIPRLFFERIYSTEELGFFSSVSTITVLISTAVGCVLLPIIPRFAQLYAEKDGRGLKKLTYLCIMITLVLGLVAILFAALFGQQALVLLFGAGIVDFAYIFVPMIIATTLTAIISCYNNVFFATNKHKMLMYISLLSIFICIAISYVLTFNFYMMGILYCLIVVQVIEITLMYFSSNKVIIQLSMERDK